MKHSHDQDQQSESNEPEILSNQTNFFDEELLVQTPPSLPVEPDPFQAQKDAMRKKNKKLFIMLGTASTGVLCIGGALLLLFSPTVQNAQIVRPSPIVISNQSQKSELSKRIDELESDLKAADPIEIENPFPPISLDLSLDQTRR